MAGHPLDSDTPNTDSDTPGEADPDAWDDLAEEAGPTPERPLLKPSVILLIAGGVVAFLAGVAATNSSPNSAGEVVGSWMNRAGVICMLVACCGILFAYRYADLRDMAARASSPTWPSNDMANILICNLGIILVCEGLLFSLSALQGNWVLLPAAAVFSLHLSISVTMMVYHTGPWRAYGIGVATTILFVFAGGMMNYLWGFLFPQVWMGATRGRGDMPIWPVVLLHLFVILNGIVCAGYVSLLSFLSPAAEKAE